MLLFQNQKLAILQIPRTGSTSLTKALFPHASMAIRAPFELKHLRLRRFDKMIRPYLPARARKDLETVTLMRDPIDWLKSWYRYRHRAGAPAANKPPSDLDFEGFCDAYLSPNRPAFVQLGRQDTFYRNPDNGTEINQIFRYEKRDVFYDFLADRLNISLVLEKSNASPDKPAELGQDMQNRLESYFQPEYEMIEALKKKGR